MIKKYTFTKINKKEKGFVILFAVTISSILLAISLGVASIAFKEIRFGTSAKDANDAFFSADTGYECALFNDKETSNVFVSSGGTGKVICKGLAIDLDGSYPSWSFVVPNLGGSGTGCAKVSVYKDDVSEAPYIKTTVISKGYNFGDVNCNSLVSNRIEREEKITY